ncbi:NACHT, LRR and PYD domains-containing protein 6 [Balearica regulorum gibbericeps]|uniref:NACHT, LRR and PYD domains-containing protein 6 n=1 Tax=Balearica regulorum gibbericeps TaxID=100784 RepID=UPI003F60F6F2
MGGCSSRHCALSGNTPKITIEEVLLRALEDLSEQDFKKFRDALADRHLQGQRHIPWGRLEKADRLDTKRLMLSFYGKEEALDMAIAIFERIQCRDKAAMIQEKREEGGKAEWLPTLGLAPLLDSSSPDCQRKYKEAILREFSHIKDQNARMGENVDLHTRYSKLVIVTKHLDEEQREHIMDMGRKHVEIMKEQASSSIAVGDLFKPDSKGWAPKVVVLLGAAGMGKTVTARKIMLDWASDKLFMEFDYVFYIHCREGNLLTPSSSMDDLISQCYPGSNLPVATVLAQPEKLLFVIDGFDELRSSFDLLPCEPCSQPEERQVEDTLSSLLCRKVLPESSLIITTRPAALQKLGKCLVCERYAEILGFSEAERKEYFHTFFQNTEQATAAFQFVRGNETLFTMCLVPIVCWIVCTVVKQQLSRSGGLTQSPKTTTGIYTLYLSALLQSVSSQLKQDMPGVLRRLCCLAADGVWKQKVLFEEKEVQRYALDQREALPLLLNEHIFQRDISCVSTYSFIHLSFQEFFAALFYLLEDEGEARDLPAGPTRDVKELLESHGNSRNFCVLTVRFLFGLLNEEHRRKLEEIGCRITPRITQELLAWLQNSQKTALALLMPEMAVIRNLEVCHCLYELQDQQFVVAALDPFTRVYLQGFNLNHFDQMVLSFSVKNIPKLESLEMGHCSFLWDDPEDCVDPQPAKKACGCIRPARFVDGISGGCLSNAAGASTCPGSRAEPRGSSPHLPCRFSQCQLTSPCCGALAFVISAKPTLTDLDLAGNEDLRDDGVKLLCEGLRCGTCQLQTLRLGCCNITATSCKDLAAVLGAMPSLVQLDLSDNPLEDGGVQELCRALAGPGRSLEKLWLWRCRLTEASCRTLAAVLPASPSLKELHLGENELGDRGVRRLSKGLQDPACRLQILRLWRCRLTKASCRTLAAVLPASPSLKELHLGGNELGDRGVRRLSKGLQDPACRLQILSLWQCRLAGACCTDLCALLSTSQSLQHLDLSENDLGDGSVRLLCETLRNCTCVLKVLWLKKSGLNEETLQKLAALQEVNHNLNIGYI